MNFVIDGEIDMTQKEYEAKVAELKKEFEASQVEKIHNDEPIIEAKMTENGAKVSIDRDASVEVKARFLTSVTNSIEKSLKDAEEKADLMLEILKLKLHL